MMKKKLALLVSAVMLAAVFPIVPAQAAPMIELLNPSGYSEVPELSTKEDAGNTYHFVAWTADLPASPFVEFHLIPTGGNAITIEANPVGGATFEAFHNLASLVDGQYTVRAILYSGQNQVAVSADEIVTINNSGLPPPPQAETVEILNPQNGGQLGFFTPPSAAPRTLIDVDTSDAARQVRAFYTTSPPGTAAAWTACGTGTVTDGSARVRCTLADDAGPTQVTAVAAVANTAPPGTPAMAPTDDAGDAHRVLAYVSQPTEVNINPEATATELSACLELIATVLDQNGRPLQGVPVDVHAVGPDDQLQFGTGGNTDDFQAPDEGGHSTENARLCDDFAPDAQQGETNRFAADDQKHIESLAAGTDNAGSFTFALFSNQAGGTQVTVWADVNDNDVQSASEASGGARIGWGQDPPPPVRQLFLEPASPAQTVGSCQRFLATAKESGNPLPGANVDVHIGGSDTAAFCTPPDATTPSGPPDSGDHVAGSHSDGTKHLEGPADSLGRFVFGVTSPSETEVSVTVWLDESDDDTFVAGEPTETSQVSFTVSGERSISLQSNRRRVSKGRRVRLSGSINGSEACSARERVKLKARRPNRRFRTIASKRTQGDGDYSFRVRVRRTKDYRAIAPRNGPCERARSRIVRVRVRR